MKHAEAARLDDLLGTQQHLAPVGRHRLVRLDAPEAGVLVAQIAEAGHQQPLVGGVAALVNLAARVVLGHLADQGLVVVALLEQRRQGLRDQSVAMGAYPRAEFGHELSLAALRADGLG